MSRDDSNEATKKDGQSSEVDTSPGSKETLEEEDWFEKELNEIEKIGEQIDENN